MVKLPITRELLIVLLSIAIQVPLAIFLGHQYDESAFIDTGYLVNAGLNPYQPHLITIFSPQLVGFNPIIGDPPPWPLLLGLIYRLTYNVVPNIFLYNFAIKIPIIASNIGLACISKKILMRQGASQRKIESTWLFLLFNPLVLLTTTAWGQFDTLIALLCVASLYLLSRGWMKKSAVLISLSVVLKPISLPLIGLPLLFSKRNWLKILQYIAISTTIIVVLWILPFYIFGWILPSSSNQVSSFFTRAGGLTLFSLVEVLQNTVIIPKGLEFLGYIWIPALILGYYLVYRNPPKTFNELTQKAIGLMLIFFLTYSWIAEPYINVLIVLVLLALPLSEMNFRNFHFIWVLTLIFMVVTTNFTQLFFLVSPQSLVSTAIQIENNIRSWRLITRFLIVIIWQFFAWRLTLKILVNNKFKRKISTME